MTGETDVELISSIEVAFSERHVQPSEERRTAERRRYDCTQLVAPFDQEHLPQQADFRQVRCRDLSSSGFSFFSYRRPDSTHVVVALGAIPFKFFIAEVMRTTRVNGEDGQQFLVGCRFLRRLGE